jgi:serine/threonine protein kinase
MISDLVEFAKGFVKGNLRQDGPGEAIEDFRIAEGTPPPQDIAAFAPVSPDMPYTLLERIWKGAYVDTYRARDRDGRTVAVKASRAPHESGPIVRETDTRQLIRHEASLLDRLDHPGIVKGRGVCEQDGRLYLATEYLPYSAAEYLGVRARDSSPAEAIGDFMGQLQETLRYIEEERILHLDVKPDNIRARGDGYGRPVQAVLIDFNFSRRKEADDRRRLAGTAHYVAPERLIGIPAPNADVYGFGQTIVDLLAELEGVNLPGGYFPDDWEGHNERRRKALEKSGVMRRYPSALSGIMDSCLSWYLVRPSAAGLGKLVMQYQEQL